MRPYVVDTNVAIAANGRNTHADPDCQRACIRELLGVCRGKVVAIDDSDRIFEEYSHHLSFAGAPGVGDMFFKYIHDHKWNPTRVSRVSITCSNDDSRGFEELPENKLDKSDRKFLATAVSARAAILNATDSDWSEQEALTSQLGVQVRQICPQHATKN